MAKAKIARKSTAIDMTPMVDLAFLLITFFMLTIKFKPPESVTVTTPTSTASTPQPPKDIMNISIDRKGRVFIGLVNQPTRIPWLERVAKAKSLSFDEKELKLFSVLGDVGVPINNLKQFLNLTPDQRTKVIEKTSGIPTDSTNNELDTWVKEGRLASYEEGVEVRIVIKADEKTPYPVIREVINTLKKQKANRFNLITAQEADPRRTLASNSIE